MSSLFYFVVCISQNDYPYRNALFLYVTHNLHTCAPAFQFISESDIKTNESFDESSDIFIQTLKKTPKIVSKNQKVKYLYKLNASKLINKEKVCVFVCNYYYFQEHITIWFMSLNIK